jgi:hypothetical protein
MMMMMVVVVVVVVVVIFAGPVGSDFGSKFLCANRFCFVLARLFKCQPRLFEISRSEYFREV